MYVDVRSVNKYHFECSSNLFPLLAGLHVPQKRFFYFLLTQEMNFSQLKAFISA